MQKIQGGRGVNAADPFFPFWPHYSSYTMPTAIPHSLLQERDMKAESRLKISGLDGNKRQGRNLWCTEKPEVSCGDEMKETKMAAIITRMLRWVKGLPGQHDELSSDP